MDVVIGTIFGCAVGFVILFYLSYCGLSARLEEATPGQMYSFDYLQPKTGNVERKRVRIVEKSTISENDISRLNLTSAYRRNDPIFERTNTLVVGETNDGVRNFYAERATNCRRLLTFI